jgi:hypothetical protein
LIYHSLAGSNVDSRKFEPIVAIVDRDPVCYLKGRLAERLIVRVKQNQAWTSVKLSISHHLINIGLRHALFRVVDPSRDPLLLRVDNLF